jgi:hypothetical protein
MGWTRFGELSAETQSLADVAGLGGAGYAVSSTAAFTGSWSYRTSSTNAPLGFAGAFGAAARCGLMFRHNGVSGGQPGVIGMLVDGCTLLFRFNQTNNDVTLTAGYTSNTTNVRTALTVNVPALADVNTWRHIGMTASMLSSGGFVSLYVDGVQVAEWTGDTQLYRSGETTPRTNITAVYAAGAGAAWTGITTGTWSNYAYIDDFYADWWSGESAPTDAPVPSRRFYAVLPTADVTENWTPSAGSDHYALVDDAAPDDDTTYVVATSAGLLNQYAVSGFVLPADYAVRAVIRKCYGKKSDAGADSRVTLSISDGVDTLESETLPLPTAYGYVRNRWETQPDGVSAWDETAVNAVIIGTESAGDF